jgi:integrase/recombinase XerD
LHQLRHSALTHLAEQNVSLPLLMAKSRHASLRSLQRYARPGAEAVAAMTAATDQRADAISGGLSRAFRTHGTGAG